MFLQNQKRIIAIGDGLTQRLVMWFTGKDDHGLRASLTRLVFGLTTGGTLNSKGWSLGLLVARSVFEGYGNSVKPWDDENISERTWYRRNGSIKREKLSARAFSRQADVCPETVTKCLMAWNKAAVDGLVPHSSELGAGQEIKEFILDERHTHELWDQYYHEQGSPCVYFIGYKDLPDLPVKIGKSKDVKNRLSSLQTGSGMELEILFTVPGYSEEEETLHKLFDGKKTQGEWFNLTSEDLEWVRENYEQ